MTEEVPAFLGGELIEELADPIPEVRDGSLGGFSEERLEFSEELFDGVEVGWPSIRGMQRNPIQRRP